MDYGKKALAAHQKLAGKIEMSTKASLDSREKLSLYYTPGVAAVSRLLAKKPQLARDYTWLGNSVAVISDGSAVLGLGDIGPYGALPVMEGKAMIFKDFAGIDAIPIVLNVHQPEQIIQAVSAIAPSFGGINLEDIAAPECFEIENQLQKSLPIPVFHDDQHGTSIVVLAGLLNACQLTGRTLNSSKIVISGVGAAGVATARLLKKSAPKATILAVDSQGLLYRGRAGQNPVKKRLLASRVVSSSAGGNLAQALESADIFVGVSKGGIVSPPMVASMSKDPIVIAMANPSPEILPDDAKLGGAAIVATGRSDLPNQINNALAFPGIFRGALDNKVKKITDQMKIKAAYAIASMVKNPTPENIIPPIFNKKLVATVAKSIK